MVKRLEWYWERQAERIASALDLDDELPDVFDAFDTDEEIKALVPIIQSHMERIAESSAWDVLNKWNPESEGWGPELIAGWLAKAALTNADSWCRTVEQQLASRATEPEGTSKIGEYLASAGPVWLGAKFALEAQSFGRQDAAAKSGLMTKTWKSKKNSRPSHAAQNGVTVGIDDVFPNGLRWPGDRKGDASETAECNCILEYGRDE